MKQRCGNSNDKAYKYYGGRSIKICNRWLGRGGYNLFYADLGPRPSSEYTLERIDNDGDYSPENCRWATWKEQARNRRSNRMLTFQGRTQSITEWAEETGIPRDSIRNRLRYKWPVSRVLTTPNKPNPRITIKPGDRVGGWLVLREIRRKGQRYFLCRCECDREFEVNASNLNQGHTKRCRYH